MSTVSYSELLKSPSDVSSRSVSPVILRPSMTPTSRHKQRSSSMNSVSSVRSMSIVSIESSRNSIVSVDDIFMRPARENSSSSLVSLGMSGCPLDSSKDTSGVGSRHPRLKTKTCALFSDEEFSEPEQSQILNRAGARGRRRSSDKVHKPDYVLSFKKNFKFKCDGYVKPKIPTSTAHLKEESMPSPLSSAIESPQPIRTLDSEQLNFPLGKHPGNSSSKKTRSSSMTQSMFLKRKLLFSKDIQLEVLSGHTSTTAAYPTNGQESRTPNNILLHQGIERSISPDETPQHQYRETFVSSPAASLKAQHARLNLLPPLHGHPFNTLTTSVSPPTELSLNQQNKLISELNRKWNRAMYSPSMEIYAQQDQNSLEFAAGRLPISKKRGRSESSSSADSLNTNFS